MKTIKKENEIKRVKDKVAIEMVKNGWEYCPKSEWKQQNRNKKVVLEDEKEISDNLTDKNKRKARKNAKRNRQSKS